MWGRLAGEHCSLPIVVASFLGILSSTCYQSSLCFAWRVSCLGSLLGGRLSLVVQSSKLNSHLLHFPVSLKHVQVMRAEP